MDSPCISKALEDHFKGFSERFYGIQYLKFLIMKALNLQGHLYSIILLSQLWHVIWN